MNSENQNANVQVEGDIVNNSKPTGEVSFSKIKIRVTFALILVVVLMIYLFSALGYSFAVKEANKPAWIDILAYIHLIVSFLILGGSTYELSKTFGFKHWYIHTIFIICTSILFYLPITLINSNYPIWIYIKWPNELKSFIPLIWGITFVIFILISILLFTIKKRLNVKDFLLFIGYILIVVLGLKGVSSLALTPVNPSSEVMAGAQSVATIIWIWIMVIAADTFAYFFGIKWGKTKLAPNISPKKSVEGAIGGFIGGFLVGAIYAFILLFAIPNNEWFIPFKAITGYSPVWVKIVLVLIFSILIPILSIMGDLVFSMLKRMYDIKDFSNLIPGHGGVLDRLDSVLFTTFVIEIIILIIN